MTGASSEYTAPILSAYLYGINDPEKLTQEQKDTITSIITLASTATTYGVTGDTSGAVSASEVGKVGVENNYFYPIRNEIPIDILDLNIQGDERYVVYVLAEYMVKQRMLELYDVPSFVYSDMVDGVQIQDTKTGKIINKNPTEEDYRKNFNTGNIISHDQFEALIKKHPQAYNRLIEGISNQKTLNGIKDLGLKVTGGLSGVAVSFGQIGEPILHPIETAKALYQFVTTEDKLLAIQLAVAMDLQNRQELLELHHQNNDTFGVALETSKNTADALLVLGSIHKAPKEIVTLIPTLKNAGSVVFNGVKYTYSEGKIFAQKILSPNTNVNAHVPTNKDLPKVYGDGDLGDVYKNQKQHEIDSPYHRSVIQDIDESRKAREASNFDFDRQKRVEHNAKLTTTVDGNLSVTHGLSYDAKKELDGIRAALIKDQEDVKAFNKTTKRGERKQESLVKAGFDINKDISVATATVTTKDGKTINYLAVSGQSWNPNAPDKVTINGKEYHVLRGEATTTKVINGKNEEVKILPNRPNPDNNQENGNHAEKKIMSHITQKNQNGANIDSIQLNIQNTSKSKQGACSACGGKDGTGGTIQDFKNLNQNIKIHIEHGSTKTSK